MARRTSAIGTAHGRPALLRHLRRRCFSSRTERSLKFEERVRMASETAARIYSYVQLLCLEAVGRVAVKYFDASVGWVQQ